MVTQVIIRDNTKSPVKYIQDLPNFKNGTGYEFKPGPNIIVGENGSGKTTLINLIRAYLLVGEKECETGIYNSVISKLYKGVVGGEFLDGVDVFADYDKNTFRLCHAHEKTNDNILRDFNSIGTYFTQAHASSGESVKIGIMALFNYMFSKDAILNFDYTKLADDNPEYMKYISEHRISDDYYTILMDEPDRNLDIKNAKEIEGVLSFNKPQTQLIATVHNPLIIYALSKCKGIHFIELTPNYVKNVCEKVNELISPNHE